MNVDDQNEKTVERTISALADSYQFNETDCLFKLKYYIAGVPFHFHWKLTKCDQEVVSL